MFKFCQRLILKASYHSYKEFLSNRQFETYGGLYRIPDLKTRSNIIDGKSLSQRILEKLKLKVNKWIGLGNRKPHLSVILVGDNPASQLYVRNKSKAAKICGIESEIVHCPGSISEKELIGIVDDLNRRDSVDAILLQLPCPEHINETRVLNQVSRCKDVDGFRCENLGRVALGLTDDTIIPCTALAVREILLDLRLPLRGLEAVLVGCSRYIGLPVLMLLSSPHNLGLNMTATVCDVHTSHTSLEYFLRRSDVIISAVGKPGLIRGDLIKEGAIVIDVGITVINEGEAKPKILGDVDFQNAVLRAGHITPVPGGVGPVTVAMLLCNTLRCAELCQRRRLELQQANSMTEE